MATPETNYQSHPWCKPGYFALRFDDPKARDLLWLYAQRIRPESMDRSDEIHEALRETGYDPVNKPSQR